MLATTDTAHCSASWQKTMAPRLPRLNLLLCCWMLVLSIGLESAMASLEFSVTSVSVIIAGALVETPPRRRLRDSGARNTGTFVAVLVGTLAPCLVCCLCVQCLCRQKYRSYPPRVPNAPTTATAKDKRRPYSPPAFVSGSDEVREPDHVDPQAV